MKLFKNPFIRIAGVILILYIGLFKNTHEKESLGNRLSAEQIKKDLNEVKEKSAHIVTTVKMAKAYQQSQINSSSSAAIGPANFIIKDIIIGKGDEAKCEDFVSIEYRSFANNNPIGKPEKYDLVIGKESLTPVIQNNIIPSSNAPSLRESTEIKDFSDAIARLKIGNGIIGMKKGGVRLIILTNSNQALNYEVKMLELKKSTTPNPEKCNFNIDEKQ